VNLEAQPGQFYLFHSWALHGSPPNASSEPRVGLNMRFAGRGDEVDPEFEYIQLSGDTTSVGEGGKNPSSHASGFPDSVPEGDEG
jgi:ectoine hydroxylase-related dioxygenase (phytanoyl-CoA dioxygenase family)